MQEIGRFQFNLGKNKKINICLFKVSSQNKIGSVGKSFFFYYSSLCSLQLHVMYINICVVTLRQDLKELCPFLN